MDDDHICLKSLSFTNYFSWSKPSNYRGKFICHACEERTDGWKEEKRASSYWVQIKIFCAVSPNQVEICNKQEKDTVIFLHLQ